MVTAPVLVLMCDGVDNWVKFVNVGAYSKRFFLDTGINLGDGFDTRIHRFCILVDLAHELRNCLDSEVDPFAKVRVSEISNLQILAGVQASLLTECRHCVVVETRPTLFPTLEVRHPVRDIDVNSINSCC